MTVQKQNGQKQKKPGSRKIQGIIMIEAIIILALLGTYRWYMVSKGDGNDSGAKNKPTQSAENSDPGKGASDSGSSVNNGQTDNDLTPDEQTVILEQEKLKKEIQERVDLIAQADDMVQGYYYDEAIELIKGYKGSEGDYQVYPELTDAISRLETEKSSLVLYGGSYQSVTEVNHIFFHSLIVDTDKAFDHDGDAKGYNMYMVTVTECQKILKKLYDDGYVLVNVSDLTKIKKLEDGSTQYVENEIYLRSGKKPLVISQDDVSYYKYMNGDGFADRIVLDDNGKPTCEMHQEDGSVTTGAFDLVPVVDEFVKAHPDFSYRGAKGLLALTGYEGVMGYRTNDPSSPTYEEDVKAATKVAEALKADGWEFGSHSWGHKNMQTITLKHLEWDTNRWLKEVGPIIGPTDIFVFPFGVDIETTIGTYSSDKYKFLKSSGFNVFLGVYSKPWMHVKKDYVRMTRRPIDGQAMLEFPERLQDLFNVQEIIDPARPGKDW